MQVARPVPDFNNDGFGDLAVGAPGENVGRRSDAGAVSVLYGRATGMSSNRRVITQNTRGVAGLAEAGDRFGYAVAAGGYGRDVGGLAVGVSGEDVGATVNAGVLNVLYGVSGVRTQLLTQRNAGGAVEGGDRFGAALSRPFTQDQDVRQDLGVGAPGETVRGRAGAGAVSVLYGGASGGLGAGDPSSSTRASGAWAEPGERSDAFGRGRS
jgi:FG-GAP repeat